MVLQSYFSAVPKVTSVFLLQQPWGAGHGGGKISGTFHQTVFSLFALLQSSQIPLQRKRVDFGELLIIPALHTHRLKSSDATFKGK